MGFSHAKQGSALQPIWITLNNAKQKNIDVFRRQIYARMLEWAHDRQIPIDTGIFLDGDVVKAIVEQKFNPGEGVAHLNSAAKGLSILSCRGRNTGEIERLKEREEALTATEKNRQLDEYIRIQKNQKRAPADSFLELKQNIATFMSLVWVLFGSECDYYEGLRNVYATMDLREVMGIKSLFTPEHCRRITWAVLDDGCSYFDNVKTTLDFANGSNITFPQSYLVDILRNVRYGTMVKRANFPEEWASKKNPSPPKQPQGSPRAQGAGTSGQRAGERQAHRPQGQYQQYGVRDNRGRGDRGVDMATGIRKDTISNATGALTGMMTDIQN